MTYNCFLFFFPFCAEIIYISSSDTSSEAAAYQSSWADYLPKFDPSNSDDEIPSNPYKTLTRKELEKLAFAEKTKVLGLPNKQKCQEYGIKPFVAKIPKDATNDSRGKGKKRLA